MTIICLATTFLLSFHPGPHPQRDTTATSPADTTEVRFEEDERIFGNGRQEIQEKDPNEVTIRRTRKGTIYLDKDELLLYILSGRHTSGSFIKYRKHKRKE